LLLPQVQGFHSGALHQEADESLLHRVIGIVSRWLTLSWGTGPTG